MRRGGWRGTRAGHGRTVAASIAAILFASGTSACATGPGASGEGGTETVEAPAPAEAGIVGRWQAPRPANQDAYVEFGPEGTYIVSDGCNSTSGGWQLADDGAFTANFIGLTQVGCDNEPIPQAVADAITAAVAGNELTLTSKEGAATKLLRAGEAKATLIANWVGPASATATSLVAFDADGTWRGMADCSVYEGTWRVEFTAEDATRQVTDPQGQPATMMTPVGTPLLSIGPAPEQDTESCAPQPGAAPPAFALSYDTKYELFVSPSSMSLLSFDSPTPTIETVQFVKASEQFELPHGW